MAGSPPPPGSQPTTTTFNCPACDMPVPIRAMGRAPVVVCGACGSIVDTADSRLRIIQRFQEELVKPLLPLGQRGKVKGTEYEIIGFLVRCDASGVYAWEEYLLFNPYQGFAWLAQSEGHWNFLVGVKDIQGNSDTPEISYRHRTFKRFLRDRPRIVSVLGEFYWVLSTGDEVVSTDYISPPYFLSRENSHGEIVWSYGEYLRPEEVARAFALKKSLPKPTGISMTQPNPWRQRAVFSTLVGIAFAAILFVAHGTLSSKAPKLLFGKPFLFDPASPTSSKISTEEFVVTGRTTNLMVNTSAALENTWIDLDLTLVNLESSERDESEIEVAFYRGIDSDGPWTEGSKESDVYFASVEPGRYMLAAEVTSGSTQQAIPYTLSVTQSVPTTGNLVLGLLAILLVPVVCALGVSGFETSRWGQSDQNTA